ncbi:MAG: ankyrin repeat domain-containing protein [Cytophagales bacterium]|nr:ankyrin repeat domain-containing protein [Cytophagales bacterium]
MGKPLDDLSRSLQQGNIAVFKQTLAAVSNVNDKNRMGGTILHQYVSSAHYTSIDAQSVIGALVEAGIDINARENKIAEQRTALHLAALKGEFVICKLLIDNGATVDAQDKYGNTPLWRATMNYSGMREGERGAMGKVIQLLLDKGADPNVKNYHGFSPLDLALTLGGTDVVKYFQNKLEGGTQ